MALYKSIAQHYIKQIEAGTLTAGSRLPALRQMAKQHDVSMTTATKAYAYLEETGWIFARPQAGFFISSKVITKTPLSPTFTSDRRNPKSFAPEMGYNSSAAFFCPLGIAMLAPSLLPKAELKRAIKRTTSRISDRLFFYPEPQGEKQLRQALSTHFQHASLQFSADEISITHGCIDAIRIALETTTKIGDTIAISSPCFNGLLDLLVSLSRTIVEIPCNEQGVDLAALEEHMKNRTIQACLFNTSHLNPSGISLSTEQKQQLAQMAANYQIPIIEDDVYIELSHRGKPPLPAKHWDKAGYILWCGSISKSLAEGARLGWCLPGRYLSKYVDHQRLTNYGINYITQMSFAEFFNGGEYRTYIKRVQHVLYRQLQDYQQLLQQQLPENARISMPDGGLVLWIQIPELDATQLEKDAQEQGIDIRSGTNFSTLPLYKNYFRINCGWPLDEVLTDNTSPRQKLLSLCQMIKKI